MNIDIPDELAELLRRFDANEPPFKTDHDRLVELREQLHRSRVAGAKKTNAMQSQAATDFWEPWIAAYRLYRSNGASRSDAIKQVMQDMENAGCPRSQSTTYE